MVLLRVWNYLLCKCCNRKYKGELYGASTSNIKQQFYKVTCVCYKQLLIYKFCFCGMSIITESGTNTISDVLL